MTKVRESILSALLIGSFVTSTQAMAQQEASNDKTAEAIVTAYRGVEATSARAFASADYLYALDQLALARGEVKRLISEIKIEGAENVEIGGEVRAARMTEAAWKRAVETVAEYIARLDSMVAER